MTRLGQCCLLARRLIEGGVRFVTINAFLTVFDEITWDIHGSKPFTSIEGMCDIVCPMYDQAYTALLEDLAQRGMLDTTLVCNLAEFGRTPRVNPAGGRDHWPLCYTVAFAGGGVQGGRVVGASDPIGAVPGGPSGRAGRHRRDDLPQPGPQPRNQAPGPGRAAVSAGRCRTSRNPGALLNPPAQPLHRPGDIGCIVPGGSCAVRIATALSHLPWSHRVLALPRQLERPRRPTERFVLLPP